MSIKQRVKNILSGMLALSPADMQRTGAKGEAGIKCIVLSMGRKR